MADNRLLAFETQIEEALNKYADSLDQLDGINRAVISSEDQDPRVSQLGITIQAKKICYRDATRAIPLTERLSFNAPKRAVLNCQARFLTMLRGAARFVESHGGGEELFPLLEKMLAECLGAQTNLLTVRQIKKKEVEWHQNICILFDRIGWFHSSDRYKNPQKYFNHALMSLRRLGNLTDTPAVVTISLSDSNTGLKLAQVADPITTRTTAQDSAIVQWGEPGQCTDDVLEGMMRNAFKDTMVRYPSAQLSAQARYQFADTLRNAYRSTVFSIYSEYGLQTPFSDCIRTASIASDDRKISEDMRVAAASENIAQILNYIDASNDKVLQQKKENGVEQIVLLEKASRHNQSVLLNIMSEAARRAGISFSNIGVSAYAVYLRLKVTLSEFLSKASGSKKIANSRTEESRIKEVAQLITNAQEGKLVIYGCASNQNRAGTVALCALSNQIKHFFDNDMQKAAEHLAGTGHEIVRSSLLEQGSQGFKPESQKGKVFSTLFGWLASRYIYGGSSQTRTVAYLPKKCYFGFEKGPPRKLIFKSADGAFVSLPATGYYVYVYHRLSRYLYKREISQPSELREKKVAAVKEAFNAMRDTLLHAPDSNLDSLKNILDELERKNDNYASQHKISIFGLGRGLLGDVVAELANAVGYACAKTASSNALSTEPPSCSPFSSIQTG